MAEKPPSSEEYDRFSALVSQVVSVPKAVIQKRLEEHEKQSKLKMRKVADLVLGIAGPSQPAWYEVDGLPNGQKALIMSTGNPNNRWRINRIPAVDQENSSTFEMPTFETQEAALNALQEELA